MRTNAIQSETFGANTQAAMKAAKRGYSVLIDGHKYIVGAVKDKESAIGVLASKQKNFASNFSTGKINYLA